MPSVCTEKYSQLKYSETGEFMFKNIRGVISIKCEGDNIYKFINEIRQLHIVCTSQRCRNGAFFADIYSSDLEKVTSIGEEHGIEVTTVSRRGLKYKLLPYRFRFGIIAGIFFVLGFVFYFSNTVVTIQVTGNSTVTSAQVINALEDIGVYKGRFIPDIDFHSCEQKLRLSIPEIAWTGIRHTGSRIIVDITEAIPSPEAVNDDIPCNIVSTKDAQITYTEVYAGQLVRRKGDGVKKNDILVSGTVDDEKGHFLKKHAMGVIKGIYTEKVTFTQPFRQSGQVYQDTENRKFLEFFGMRIPLFLSDVDSDSFDYHERVNNFSFFGIEIPIGVVHSEYKPFVYDEVEYTREQAEKKLEEQAALYQKNFFDSKQIEVLDRKIEKQETKDGLKFTVTYKLEGEIGVDREIYVDR